MPHNDIGFYNLSDVESIKRQVAIAKNHGIYGFCIYYYWFSGKRLMEKPLDLFIEHPEIDMNFCLCWANENWTRRWDGQEKDVLIAQNYTKDDSFNFISDLKKYIQDRRYIKVNGKPIIIVYNPASIPDVRNVFKNWKNRAKLEGIGEISIWICTSFGCSIELLKLGDIVDKEIEFPPHGIPGEGIGENIPKTHGDIFNYSKLVNNILEKRKHSTLNNKLYRTVMMGWDNSARRKNGYAIFNKYDLKKYYDWLVANVREARLVYNPEERFIFINAWNEWAEGTYLEPDLKYGYANINITAKAVFNRPFGLTEVSIKDEKKISRIAVQVHIFYSELTSEIIGYLNHIPENFDCFITTDSMSKACEIFPLFRDVCHANRIELLIVDNRGRDVAPLLIQMQNRVLKYKYLCHIHTKKTKSACYGDDWRKFLFDNLLGDERHIENIFKIFDSNKEIGIIYSEPFESIRSQLIWYKEKNTAQALIEKIGLEIDLNGKLEFPAGNMFWCRTKAVKQIFEYNFTIEDFPIECGQKYETIMHSIERLWCYLAKYNGYEVKELTFKK